MAPPHGVANVISAASEGPLTTQHSAATGSGCANGEIARARALLQAVGAGQVGHLAELGGAPPRAHP